MGRLYKRSSRSYFWHATYYDASGKRHCVSTKCTDKRAAELVLRKLERTAADPRNSAGRGATLKAALERLISDRVARGKADGTIEMYRAKAGHWLRIVGDVPLSTLDAATVDDYIARRLREKASKSRTTSRSTIGKELTTLRAALKLAKRRKEISADIDEIMPIGWSNDYRPREGYVRSPDDLQNLVSELLPDRGAHVCWIVGTGSRYAESLRARRADIDPDWGSVRIRGSKTAQADRRVPIVGFMRPLLEYAISVVGGSGGALFRPWGNMGRELPEACARAGIERLTANDLRRTTATWLRQGGVAPHLIAGVLRHADSRMVERVYGRMPSESLGPAIEAELVSVPSVRVKPTARTYDGRTVH